MHGPLNVILTKCTLVYCKWLHTKWPPTCFGQKCGRLQGGETKRMDTLDKLVEFQNQSKYTRVGTLIVATIYLQLIQNRYMFRSFTVLQCSHQHCVQPVASDVEVVGYL